VPPFLSNPNAPLNSVSFDDGAGGFVDNQGNPVAPGSVHWIQNTPGTAAALGLTPFNGSSRNQPGTRGDAANATAMSLFKNTKLTERVNMRLEFTVYNPFNIQFKGTPDPFIDDGFLTCPTGVNPTTTGVCTDDTHIASSFANTRFNPSGNFQVNSVQQGIGIRRVQLGAKFIF